MRALNRPLTQLLDGAKQFIVPIFQRDYSWGTKHCLQLWNDIIRVGNDQKAKTHFLGSVVYIAAEDTHAAIPRWMVIDGQQRLTTLALLLTALRDQLKNQPPGIENLPKPEEIEDYYLCNRHGSKESRLKLRLRRTDDKALEALINGHSVDEDAEGALQENYNFFAEYLSGADLNCVYEGIKKLVIVDVNLDRGNDDPQMIFESLNSTGMDLTQADLIRNFVLMRLDETLQTSMYEKFWRPIEVMFGNRYRVEFNKFCRDFLVLKLKPSKQLRADVIYHHFRNYFRDAVAKDSVQSVLEELHRFANYYSRFSLNKETNPVFAHPSERLRALVEVASPLMLRLYQCHFEAKTLSAQDFCEAIELLESYVFRRSICDMQTRSLYQIFANIAYKIHEATPLESLKVTLYRLDGKRRFPRDLEFRDALETRDVYNTRNCWNLLDRLENNSKERTDTTSLEIEHVLPQNPKLIVAWREMLGPKWATVQSTWVHRLGNLTLTAYNQKYSDRSFADKISIPNGFKDSPLRLNQFIRQQRRWTAKEIEKRGKLLARQAVGLWRALTVDMAAAKQADIEERLAAAKGFTADTLGFDAATRALFDALRPQVLGLGSDVVELFGQHSVVYRVFEHFIEVLPRTKVILLVLNIDFDEIEDPSGLARDASGRAFIVNASETGDVIFRLSNEMQIPAAMHIVRQAYERVTQ